MIDNTTPVPAANVVLVNEEGQILMVSRKDNHELFGLVGGKFNPEDNNSPQACAIREAKEETGLDIYDLEEVYHGFHFSDDRETYTYKAKYKGEIHTEENAVVKWGKAEDLVNGYCGQYNEMVLIKMGLY